MEDEFIVLKTGRNELTKVMISEILYFKADGNYTRIKVKSGETFVICKNLKNTLADFESDFFVKINRSVVINRLFVTQVKIGNGTIVKMNNNEVFSPSKRYGKELKHIFVHTPNGAFHTPKGSFHTVKGGVSHIYGSISHNNEKNR